MSVTRCNNENPQLARSQTPHTDAIFHYQEHRDETWEAGPFGLCEETSSGWGEEGCTIYVFSTTQGWLALMAFPRISPGRNRSRWSGLFRSCWFASSIVDNRGDSFKLSVMRYCSWSDYGRRHVTANTFKYPFRGVTLTWSRLMESSRTSISRWQRYGRMHRVDVLNKYLITQILSSIFL